jgi:hypothetical protein
MQWNNIKPTKDAIIEVCNAVMGKWDIINCDFSNTSFVIYSSKITEAFYTNTKFPEILSLPEKIEEKENPQDIFRDGYNQLKTIAQKQNDRKMFLHFQAAELRSYYETLTWNKHDRYTKFQLLASKVSSDYGTSWWKGVKFVLICNLMFIVVCFGLRPINFSWSGIGNCLNLFLSSLSLISTPKILTAESNWEMNWFYLSRIPLAFGIYQTIAAFRKFGKSE